MGAPHWNQRIPVHDNLYVADRDSGGAPCLADDINVGADAHHLDAGFIQYANGRLTKRLWRILGAPKAQITSARSVIDQMTETTIRQRTP